MSENSKKNEPKTVAVPIRYHKTKKFMPEDQMLLPVDERVPETFSTKHIIDSCLRFVKLNSFGQPMQTGQSDQYKVFKILDRLADLAPDATELVLKNTEFAYLKSKAKSWQPWEFDRLFSQFFEDIGITKADEESEEDEENEAVATVAPPSEN